MMRLALRGINFLVEIQRDGVVGLFRGGVAGEFDGLGLQVELEGGGGDVGCGDGEVDDVFGGFVRGGTLGPEDCGGFY